MPPQTAYDQIERLVKKFKTLPARERNAYNEENTRKDFILSLFHVLDWDTHDARQVTAEEKISRGFVDFAFRIGEDLNKPEWSQQAIDYACHRLIAGTARLLGLDLMTDDQIIQSSAFVKTIW